jgi:hypothetical protein
MNLDINKISRKNRISRSRVKRQLNSSWVGWASTLEMPFLLIHSSLEVKSIPDQGILHTRLPKKEYGNLRTNIIFQITHTSLKYKVSASYSLTLFIY